MRICEINWIAEGSVVDRVLQATDLLPTKKVVDGSIFHSNQDNILDFVLEVSD